MIPIEIIEPNPRRLSFEEENDEVIQKSKQRFPE